MQSTLEISIPMTCGFALQSPLDIPRIATALRNKMPTQTP